MIPVLRTLMLAACAMLFQTAHAACENQFFAPDDNGNARPLNRPHAEFAAALRAANAGNATAARNLAVSYEAGYLVSRCEERAAYWYGKAARGGDQEAKRWMEEHEALARMASGPECVGAYCSGNADGRGHVAMFYAGRHGHYFAPLTINGITVEGLIDTGASSIAMSTETARKLGIDKLPGKSGSVQTANGLLTAEHVVVPEVTISGITLHDVRVAIGTTGETLIGMSFLGRLQLRMGGGVLSMSR
ncbi:retropepsin-like aspartic protease [Noviherbaspirillum sp.]|uniref:retropepsin-like aspartic protease family protein n=1 Tax=Noviherbaspirillum sp. TaxID=1926288 RepID=UPI002D3D1957|nr:retropepsin-like aspartic protease [Noviherbaspirillum sp.]HZW21936.1 retropepsin-like aspartic protease [Noviherbaspirillum sp.]